jgi:hypothetical protein
MPGILLIISLFSRCAATMTPHPEQSAATIAGSSKSSRRGKRLEEFTTRSKSSDSEISREIGFSVNPSDLSDENGLNRVDSMSLEGSLSPQHAMRNPIGSINLDLNESQDDLSSDSDELTGASSQPMKTLQKLQKMLDKTDYMTTTKTSSASQTSKRISKPSTNRGGSNTPLDDFTSVSSGPNDIDLIPSPNDLKQSVQSDTSLPPDLPPLYLYGENEEKIKEDPNFHDDRLEQQNVPPIFSNLPHEIPEASKPPLWNPSIAQQTHYPQNYPYSQQYLPNGLSALSNRGLSTEKLHQSFSPPNHPAATITNSSSIPSQSQRHTIFPLQGQQTDTLVSPLWTSKDRNKYKKMQQMQRRADEERRRLEQQLLHQMPGSTSDDDGGMSDTDSGPVGYTLPNLPVYLSDAEGESSDGGESLSSQSSMVSTNIANNYPQNVPISPPVPPLIRSDMYHPSHMQQQSQQLSYNQQVPYHHGMPFHPPNVFLPQHQQQQQQYPYINNGAGYAPFVQQYEFQQYQNSKDQQKHHYMNPWHPLQPFAQASYQQQQGYSIQHGNHPQQPLSAHPSMGIRSWNQPQQQTMQSFPQSAFSIRNNVPKSPMDLQTLPVTEIVSQFYLSL